MSLKKMLLTQAGQTKVSITCHLLLAGIFILSLLLRLFCWFMEPTLSRDAIAYVGIISAWYTKGDFSGVLSYWPDCRIPPLPVWLVLLLVKYGIPLEAAGIGLNLTLGALIPLLVYLIAKVATKDKSIAYGAALLAAVHPMLIELAIEIQRDTTYLFLIGLVLWFLLEAIQKESSFFWGVGGIFLGLSILSRFESLELLPLVFCYLAGSVCFKTQKFHIALKQLGVFYIGVIVAFTLTTWLMGVPFSYYKIYYNRVTEMVAKIVPVDEIRQAR